MFVLELVVARAMGMWLEWPVHLALRVLPHTGGARGTGLYFLITVVSWTRRPHVVTELGERTLCR